MALTPIKPSNSRIIGTIMAYADELPPRYKYIRSLICPLFGESPYLKLSTSTSKDSKKEKCKFTVIYQSPLINSISQARIILIGEMHEDPKSQMNNSQLVDALVCPKSRLYAEAIRFTANEVTGLARKTTLTTLHISSYASSHLSLYGWDDYNYRKEKADAEEQNKPIPLHFTDAIVLVEQAISVTNEFKNLCLAKGIDPYEEFSTEDPAILKAQEVMNDNLSKAGIDPSIGFEEIQKYFQRSCKSLDKTMSKGFPKRTEALVFNLQIVGDLFRWELIKGKAFFIAGLLHLEEEDGEKDRHYSLDLLYRMLKTLPAIIVAPASISPV